MPSKFIKHIAASEKAERMKPEGKYIFAVDLGANKSEIKKYFQREHKVEVLDVNIVRTKKGKKAIVTVKPGTTINEKV